MEGEKQTTGLIIGKFMPLHNGHVFLVDFARRYVDKLSVLVCSIKSEPIPGDLRCKWMKELFPDVNVLHVTDENPQEPKDHPNFWSIWHDTIFKAVPGGADYLFASEDYGFKLAEVLGMTYIPVDPARSRHPVSGTKVRNHPLEYWNHIPDTVKPYFVKRVCIFGPESTGKSTLAEKLAQHYNTVCVHEWARDWLNPKDGKCEYEDIPIIARGQLASEEAGARQANKVLFCDTDLLTTTIWSKVLFGKCPDWVKQEAEKQKYDLYLLTDIDVPWIDDKQRYLPHRRKEFLEQCIHELESKGRKYVLISGSWESRLEKAIRAVDEVLGLRTKQAEVYIERS